MAINNRCPPEIANDIRCIARNVRYYRQRRGMTQVELAARCGMTPATVGRVESELPLFLVRSDILLRLAMGLSIVPARLFEEREAPPNLRGRAASTYLSEGRADHVP